jgi:subtilase family serine protease
VDLYNNNADVLAFRSASGLSTTNLPTTVHAGTDPGQATNCTPGSVANCPSPNLNDLGEASLDVEWSGAMAPSASILFVNGKDIFNNSMTYAIDQNVAPIITMSYGDCEAAQGSSVLNAFNQLFKQANAQGQTILAAAGDTGATDCDSNTESYATEGLAVDFPGSSPYVTSMGGTMFNGDAEAVGSGSSWSTTQYWTGTSGADVVSSARSYIPEAAWNETSVIGVLSSGGGGASSFFAKPAWQVETAPGMGITSTNPSVPPDGARDVPDIALNAAVNHDGYLICEDGSCVVGFRASVNGNLTPVGGTSCDSQVFGGMLALIEQKLGSRQGNINPTLYALGNKTAYYNPTTSSVFHDVTTGSNAMPCLAGSVECASGSIGYSATTGYDLATGWGSVDLNNLASDWNLVIPLGSGSLGANLSATTLIASTSSVAAGSAVTLTANVSQACPPTYAPGGNCYTTNPTGTVQFLANNVALGSPVTLVGGVATYPFAPTCSMLGQQSVTAVYSGDTNYQGSIGPILTANGSTTNSSGAFITTPMIVNVTAGTCPDYAVTSPSGASTSVNVAAGGVIPAVTITASSANGFTGTVTFTSTIVLLSGDIAGVAPTISLSPASVTLTANGTATSTLSFTGITASLRMPNLPGTAGPATMLASHSSHRAPWNIAAPGVTLACLLLLVLPRRRRLSGLLVVALSVALAVGATGCGGSSQSAPPASNSNPYAGTYQVIVTGTFSGSPTLPPQSTTVTYIIN